MQTKPYRVWGMRRGNRLLCENGAPVTYKTKRACELHLQLVGKYGYDVVPVTIVARWQNG